MCPCWRHLLVVSATSLTFSPWNNIGYLFIVFKIVVIGPKAAAATTPFKPSGLYLKDLWFTAGPTRTRFDLSEISLNIFPSCLYLVHTWIVVIKTLVCFFFQPHTIFLWSLALWPGIMQRIILFLSTSLWRVVKHFTTMPKVRFHDSKHNKAVFSDSCLNWSQHIQKWPECLKPCKLLLKRYQILVTGL